MCVATHLTHLTDKLTLSVATHLTHFTDKLTLSVATHLTHFTDKLTLSVATQLTHLTDKLTQSVATHLAQGISCSLTTTLVSEIGQGREVTTLTSGSRTRVFASVFCNSVFVYDYR